MASRIFSPDRYDFNSIVRNYLGEELPSELVEGVDLSDLGNEACRFLERLLNLMRQAKQPVADFSPYLIWELTAVIPNALPEALGGRIPPITSPGRHKIFDAYVKRSISAPLGKEGFFIDVGCGFPPVTTVDTAKRFQNWKVVGIDRSFAPYIVYDQEGHYACFGWDGKLQYLQPRLGTINVSAFYNNPVTTRNRFMLAFDRLHSKLAEVEENVSQSVETGGYKLTLNAIRNFETEKLTFLETELGECDLPPADVVRCMNVFVYFDGQTRLRMMTQAGKMLDEGGILLSGTNQASGRYRRYVVYRKKREHLNPAEFAFSPDTLRPLSMMPWFTIHEEDPEATLLAELIAAVRSNEPFWKDFSARVDTLLEQHDICRRSGHGFLVSPVKQKSIPELRELIRALWQQIITEGYVAGVVNALCAAGYNAFENIVGDIAIRPQTGGHFSPLPLT